MAVYIIAFGLFLVLLAFQVRSILRRRKLKKALQTAKQAGVSIDDAGNIDAETSFAGMMLCEESSGKKFTGTQAHFMELVRIVSEGPKTADEIRFLFAEGIDPVVRPDGQVYVPCIENEHLYMDGEIELVEEDLDAILERQELLQVCEETGTRR